MHPAFDAIVDYAGLFPPASCSMDEAVAQYAQYRAGPDRAMLGRFVLSAGRLLELGEAVAAQGLLPGSAPPWQLSVVFGANHPEELERITAFESAFAGRGLEVGAIEAKVGSAGETSVVAERIDPRWERFFEVPHLLHYGDLIGAIRDAGAGAKIRTGGTSPDAFPSAIQMTRFLMAVTRYGVPFKATAGLHHPWRGQYPLTYEADSERHTMFGFMNVMIATAILRAGGEGETAQAVLEESDASTFERFGDVITWRGERIEFDDLVALRRDGFRGFGSCSFREPVDELAMEIVS